MDALKIFLNPKFLFGVPFYVLLFSSCAFNPGQRVSEEVITERREMEFQGQKVVLAPLSDAIERSKQVESSFIPPEIKDYKTPEYRLGAYDVVSVIVWNHPELSTPLGQFRSDIGTGLLIDENGFMYYPYIGQLKVEGLTIGELRASLTEKLTRVLQEPQVDVKVLKHRSKRVEVYGKVQKSSTLFLQDIPMTVSEAINRSGGIKENGDASKVELIRDNKSYSINLWSDSEFNVGKIELKEGDEIRVPSSSENKVYLAGALVKTGAIPLNNGKMSLTQAVLEFGGLSQVSSNAEALYVMRMEEGNIHVYNIDVQNPMAFVIADMFEMRPRDFVFVDTHDMVEWNRFLNLILPTVNMINMGAATGNEMMILKGRLK